MSGFCPVIDKTAKNICRELGIDASTYRYAFRILDEKKAEITADSIRKLLFTPRTIQVSKLSKSYASLLRACGSNVIRNPKYPLLFNDLITKFPKEWVSTYVDNNGKFFYVLNNVTTQKVVDRVNSKANESDVEMDIDEQFVLNDNGENGKYLTKDYMSVTHHAQKIQKNFAIQYGEKYDEIIIDNQTAKDISSEIYKIRDLGIRINVKSNLVGSNQNSSVESESSIFDTTITINIGSNISDIVPQLKELYNNLKSIEIKNNTSDEQPQGDSTGKEENQKETKGLKDKYSDEKNGSATKTELLNAFFKEINSAIYNRGGGRKVSMNDAEGFIKSLADKWLYQARADEKSTAIKSFLNDVKNNTDEVLFAYSVSARNYLQKSGNEKFMLGEQLDIKNDERIDKGEESGEVEDEVADNDSDSSPIGGFNKDIFKDEFDLSELDERDLEIFSNVIEKNLLGYAPSYYEPSQVIAALKQVIGDTPDIDSALESFKQAAKEYPIIKALYDRIIRVDDNNIVEKNAADFIRRLFVKTQTVTFSPKTVNFDGDGKCYVEDSEVKSRAERLAGSNAAAYIAALRNKTPEEVSKLAANFNNISQAFGLQKITGNGKFRVEIKNTAAYQNYVKSHPGKQTAINNYEKFLEYPKDNNEALKKYQTLMHHFGVKVPEGTVFTVSDFGDIISYIGELGNQLTRSKSNSYRSAVNPLIQIFKPCYKSVDILSTKSYQAGDKIVTGAVRTNLVQDVLNNSISKMDKNAFHLFVNKQLPSDFYMQTQDDGSVKFNNDLLEKLDNDDLRSQFDFAYAFSSENEYMKSLTPEQLFLSDITMYFHTKTDVAYCAVPMQSLKKSWNYAKLPIYNENAVSNCANSIVNAFIQEAKYKAAVKGKSFVKNENLYMAQSLMSQEAFEKIKPIIDKCADDRATTEELNYLQSAIEASINSMAMELHEKAVGTNAYGIKDFTEDQVKEFVANSMMNNVWMYMMIGIHPSLYKANFDAFKRMAGAHNTGKRLIGGTKFNYVVIEDIKGLASDLFDVINYKGFKEINVTDGQGFETYHARNMKKNLGAPLGDGNKYVDDAGVPLKSLVFGKVVNPANQDVQTDFSTVPSNVYFKYSEALMNTEKPEYFGTKLTNLFDELYEQHGETVHGVVFDSCVKAGMPASVVKVKDLVEKYNNKEITRDQMLDEIVDRVKAQILNQDGTLNQNGVLSFDSSNFMYAAETSDHFTDHEDLKVSTQFYAVFAPYDELTRDKNGETLNQKIAKSKDKSGNFDLAKSLMNRMLAKNNLAGALQVKQNPGKAVTASLFNLDDRLHCSLSAIKKSGSFHESGGALYQICQVESQDLKMVTEGKGENARLKYAEVEIPLPSLEKYKDYIDEDTLEVDSERLLQDHPELNYVIAYRTPTGGFKSIMPCKVKRFISPLTSGVMHCPKEITLFMGSDHDGDKLSVITMDKSNAEEFTAMMNILTMPGSLKRYCVDGFSKEFDIACKVGELFGVHDQSGAITPIGVDSRYISYGQVLFSQNALAILAKQKSLASLAVASIPKEENRVKLDFSCKICGNTLSGGLGQNFGSIPIAATTSMPIRRNGVTELDDTLAVLGSLVEAGSDVLTNNLFPVAGIDQKTINMFISIQRAGIPLELCYAFCHSDFVKDKWGKLKKELDNEIQDYAAHGNGDVVDITPELLARAQNADGTEVDRGLSDSEKYYISKLVSALKTVSYEQRKVDSVNKNYSGDFKSFFDYVKKWTAYEESKKNGKSKIKWVEDRTSDLYETNMFLDTPIALEFMSFYRRNKDILKDLPESKLKKVMSCLQIAKFAKSGFFGEDNYATLRDRLLEKWNDIPEGIRKYLYINTSKSEFGDSINANNITINERSIFRDAWASFYESNRDLAMDLYKYSLLKSGIFYGYEGFSHLAPVNLLNDEQILECDSSWGDENIDVEALAINMCVINGVMPEPKTGVKNKWTGKFIIDIPDDVNYLADFDNNKNADLSDADIYGGIYTGNDDYNPVVDSIIEDYANGQNEYVDDSDVDKRVGEVGSIYGVKVSREYEAEKLKGLCRKFK